MPEHIIGSEAPTGPKPEVAEPQLVPTQGDVEDLSPELQGEMDRIMDGEPEPERQQLDDWPLPKPSQVSPGTSRDEELAGDEGAVDERADPRE